MDAETELIFDLCVRHRGLTPRYTSSCRPFDLTRVIAMASNHKVLPLLYAAWKVHGPPLTSEGWGELKRAVSTRTLVQTLLLDEWAGLEPRLRVADVRCLMMKGPALALQFHGDPRARDYRDIDLLVEAGGMERAVRVFLSAGYAIKSVGTPPEGAARSHFLRITRHLVMVKPGRPLHFELHASGNAVQGLTRSDVQGLFLRSETLDFGGVKFPTLGRSDHAVMALLHGTRHGWATLQWVLDGMAAIAEIHPSKVNALSWDHLDLSKALDLFGLWVTEHVSSPALDVWQPPGGPRTRRAQRLAALVRPSLASCGQTFAGRRRALRYHFFYLAGLQKGLAGRGRSLWNLVSTNTEDLALFLALPYPFVLMTLARPFLTLRRWGRPAS